MQKHCITEDWSPQFSFKFTERGNILGANILNISVIIGVSTLVSDKGLIVTGHTLFTDIPMAMLVSFLFVVVGLLKGRIGRVTGLMLLGTYIFYLFMLF